MSHTPASTRARANKSATPISGAQWVEVGKVQQIALHLQHAQDVVPLPVGGLAAEAIPFELGQDGVFGAGEKKEWSVFPDGDAYPSGHLRLRKCIGTKDENIHLQHGVEVNDVKLEYRFAASRIASTSA
jgi:hypothetical protein